MRTLQWNIAPVEAYITQEGQSICNEFQLTILSRQTTSAAMTMEADSPTGGLPVLSIKCDWENQYTSLCTREDAAEIRVSPVSSEWSIAWEGEGWICKPPDQADLSQGFQVSFLFSNVVIQTKEYTAVLDLVAHHFPDFPDHSAAVVTLEKRYPLQINYFRSNVQVVERGETCLLSWSVRNGNECSLSGEPVHLKGSREVTVYADRQRFYLEAHNEFNRHVGAQLEMRLTNWKLLGTAQNNPLTVTQSTSNHRMLAYRGELIACIGGKLCAANPAQSLSWREIASIPWNSSEQDYNTSILFKDELQLVTARKAYSYSLKENKWETLETRLTGSNPVACAAAMWGQTPVHAAVGGRQFIQLSLFDRTLRRWNPEYYFKVSDEMERITGLDLIAHQGVLYLAASGQGEIYLYRSDDMDHWTLCTHAAFQHNWFLLASCGNRLFLLQAHGMVDLMGGTLYDSFPTLPDTQTARICAGVLENSMYVTAVGTAGDAVSVLRFRP